MMDFLTSTTHLHITLWVVGLILFFVAALSAKKLTPVHMTLRLFYILIIASGVGLYIEHRETFAKVHDGSGMLYDMKFMFGILLIAFMELVLVRKGKGKSTKAFWILFGISLLAVLLIGLGGGIGVNLNLY
jgi:disulfide bond formation protein DsbB